MEDLQRHLDALLNSPHADQHEDQIRELLIQIDHLQQQQPQPILRNRAALRPPDNYREDELRRQLLESQQQQAQQHAPAPLPPPPNPPRLRPKPKLRPKRKRYEQELVEELERLEEEEEEEEEENEEIRRERRQRRQRIQQINAELDDIHNRRQRLSEQRMRTILYDDDDDDDKDDQPSVPPLPKPNLRNRAALRPPDNYRENELRQQQLLQQRQRQQRQRSVFPPIPMAEINGYLRNIPRYPSGFLQGILPQIETAIRNRTENPEGFNPEGLRILTDFHEAITRELLRRQAVESQPQRHRSPPPLHIGTPPPSPSRRAPPIQQQPIAAAQPDGYDGPQATSSSSSSSSSSGSNVAPAERGPPSSVEPQEEFDPWRVPIQQLRNARERLRIAITNEAHRPDANDEVYAQGEGMIRQLDIIIRQREHDQPQAPHQGIRPIIMSQQEYDDIVAHSQLLFPPGVYVVQDEPPQAPPAPQPQAAPAPPQPQAPPAPQPQAPPPPPPPPPAQPQRIPHMPVIERIFNNSRRWHGVSGAENKCFGRAIRKSTEGIYLLNSEEINRAAGHREDIGVTVNHPTDLLLSGEHRIATAYRIPIAIVYTLQGVPGTYSYIPTKIVISFPYEGSELVFQITGPFVEQATRNFREAHGQPEAQVIEISDDDDSDDDVIEVRPRRQAAPPQIDRAGFNNYQLRLVLAADGTPDVIHSDMVDFDRYSTFYQATNLFLLNLLPEPPVGMRYSAWELFNAFSSNPWIPFIIYNSPIRNYVGHFEALKPIDALVRQKAQHVQPIMSYLPPYYEPQIRGIINERVRLNVLLFSIRPPPMRIARNEAVIPYNIPNVRLGPIVSGLINDLDMAMQRLNVIRDEADFFWLARIAFEAQQLRAFVGALRQTRTGFNIDRRAFRYPPAYIDAIVNWLVFEAGLRGARHNQYFALMLQHFRLECPSLVRYVNTLQRIPNGQGGAIINYWQFRLHIDIERQVSERLAQSGINLNSLPAEERTNLIFSMEYEVRHQPPPPQQGIEEFRLGGAATGQRAVFWFEDDDGQDMYGNVPVVQPTQQVDSEQNLKETLRAKIDGIVRLSTTIQREDEQDEQIPFTLTDYCLLMFEREHLTSFYRAVRINVATMTALVDRALFPYSREYITAIINWWLLSDCADEGEYYDAYRRNLLEQFRREFPSLFP